jgi:FixJ family two-component response regulator
LTSITKKIVAIVDDDPGMRRALRTLLSAFGYAVYTFDSAESLLSTAATSEADCLIVDVQLGDSSGIELGRQLAAGGFNFPMIFIEAIVRGTERSCWRS